MSGGWGDIFRLRLFSVTVVLCVMSFYVFFFKKNKEIDIISQHNFLHKPCTDKPVVLGFQIELEFRRQYNHGGQSSVFPLSYFIALATSYSFSI